MSAELALEKLRAKKLKLAFGESLTGGLLSAEFVAVPGASEVVLGGILAYQTGLKSALLGVSSELLAERGAVDPEVAVQMADGARARLSSKLLIDIDSAIGLSTTGVAGPDTQDGKPVGLVYVGVCGPKGMRVFSHEFSGDRTAIRQQSVQAAVADLLEYLQS
jgi:nicotinamide-nucleotide amidase